MSQWEGQMLHQYLQMYFCIIELKINGNQTGGLNAQIALGLNLQPLGSKSLIETIHLLHYCSSVVNKVVSRDTQD